MPRSHYYDDLSGDSSDGCASGSDCDDFADEAAIEGFIWGTNPPRSNDEKLQGKHQRTVVHADVDCFYCQCEMIDRGLDPKRPLAIGQKHIVVTCNYAAREAGVTKLMSRDEARRRCPHLQVVEGSDLERYRVHGRKIYESFRRAFLKLRPGSAVCKGSMDEMMAQLNTTSAAAGLKGVKSNDQFNSNDVYVYDDQAVTMTEDQTGARTVVFQGARYAETDEAEDPDTFHSLLDTASIALQVRQIVYDETGFTTTIGVSCSPMLAKLASGLHKPGKVNILKPGSSSRRLVESMPLRKVPGIGSRTIKVLEPCLASSSRGDVSSPWTCR